jgi:ribosome maturation factor RimP
MAFEIDQVREIADRVAASSGLEIVELEMRGGGKARMLRIFIDKPGGVTHEDCANLSREVGTILDVEDAVSGKLVKLTTREPVLNNRHFEGRLEAFRDNRLTLDISDARRKFRPKDAGETRQLEIELANIEKANLVPEI